MYNGVFLPLQALIHLKVNAFFFVLASVNKVLALKCGPKLIRGGREQNHLENFGLLLELVSESRLYSS